MVKRSDKSSVFTVILSSPTSSCCPCWCIVVFLSRVSATWPGFSRDCWRQRPWRSQRPSGMFFLSDTCGPQKNTYTSCSHSAVGKSFQTPLKFLQGLKYLQKKMFFLRVLKRCGWKNSCSGPWTSFKGHFLCKNTQCWPGWNSVCGLWTKWNCCTLRLKSGSECIMWEVKKSSAWLQSVERNHGDITGCIWADSQDSRNFIVVPEFNSTRSPMVLMSVLCLGVFQPDRV